MSKGAWRYDALERNTKLIIEFCEKYKFELKQLTQYQYRIEDIIDVYPVRQRWHWLKSDERGTWSNTDQLKSIILHRLPEAEESEYPEKQASAKEIVTINGTKYELASYSDPFNDGSRQATLREVRE